ncbi:carbonic anhydrase/acetyltransferase-like protein (isoleucine patch superfamily) [Rhodothalassium salexigens DSM 2132]|uniref:Carbonic anhydrase/acetyltransferase-like protein (Isoleucine patch superfamily) n=1 Tax=Rhodothalassium salexigens DSM 2132 TaxID=1188247 RepID=A0A4R2PIM9_RHOSA|nr:gamma carbonic anhydrase family protein [Rhodothalassium salexigens]MBB4211419.1 carbonic anhydrase/acetyltransferase-like protein (isoleucine patch superfamily) [Rhodothalassium salexigens DSM 2132]MBK1637752.1 gamma carbonic anhydrase family protein [Rhodothalassium salexigens DSM 2132]TCP35339.1 carbonic anhydrase/acetyltransferase-like protein (isoleucine patch superfamily) [Rhodothalassium salexigens DSM 2132]
MTRSIYSLDGIEPDIERAAFIAPDATLVGRVRLCTGASIWYHATLRGDNEWIEIGADSNIQDNSVLHTDMGAPLTVGEGVTVGHRVTLHGCTVEDGALVGMGSIVLNHATIGAGAILGAGSLVPEGKEIPAGVLAVGSPARVVRDLKPQEVNLLKASAVHYVQNARRHHDGVVPMAGACAPSVSRGATV